MWRLIISIHVSTLLISLANCDSKMSPIGDPIGPQGPTIIEKPNNLNDDLKVVSDAITAKQLDPIVKLIGQRTVKQRVEIDAAYLKASQTKKNISTSINGILTGRGIADLEDLFEGFFHPLPEYLAQRLHSSLLRSDDGTSDWTYMSIICTSSATKLKAITDAYPGINGKSITDDIDNVVKKGKGKTALLQMLDPKLMRPDSGTDQSKVDDQVKLIPANRGACGDAGLLNFLTSSSFEQIKQVGDKWSAANSQEKLAKKIKDTCPRGIQQEIFKRIVRYADDPYQYLAEEFHWGMAGGDDGLNANAHKYLLTSRNEVDLKDIIASYKKQFGNEPQKEITDNWPHNYYGNLFISVLNGNTGK